MIPQLKRITLKEVPSMGPMPHHKHFEPKEKVIVRYKSGHWTVGWVIEIANAHVMGPAKLKYVYFKDPRHSRTRMLGGYGCTCDKDRERNPSCRLCHSPWRKTVPTIAPTFAPKMNKVARLASNWQPFTPLPTQHAPTAVVAVTQHTPAPAPKTP